MPSQFHEQHDIEFRQLVLLATNIIWLALEWLYLDTHKHIMFAIVRAAYFFFIGVVRAEGTIQHDNTDLDREEELISREACKTFKVWCCDFASWCLVVWVFGRSIM